MTIVPALIACSGQGHPANNFGHGTFNIQKYAAIHGSTNPDEAHTPAGVPVDYAITVNDTGAFFGENWKVGPRGYVGGTLKARAFILIHELGYDLEAPGFQNDFGVAKEDKAEKSNDKLVDKNCRQLIEGLQ